jgi:photosystem II stability/assembly factor-like uncharacterized protein
MDDGRATEAAQGSRSASRLAILYTPPTPGTALASRGGVSPSVHPWSLPRPEVRLVPDPLRSRTGVAFALVIALLGASAGACGEAPPGGGAGEATSPPPAYRAAPLLSPSGSGTDRLLQAVSPVSAEVIWVSGHGGRWGRSLDGGATWESGVVPGQDSLQFRDVHAVHADTALLLSAGPGELSRIYRTVDGGGNWAEVWRNRDPDAFYDCLDLWAPEAAGAPRRGVAFSDAVDGRFGILVSEDGGATWALLPEGAIPAAQEGEGGFAASGTCVLNHGPRHGWIGTGAAPSPRVLRTRDGGRSWEAAPTPLPGGDFSGITSLAFRDSLTGWAFGGNLGEPGGRSVNVARTTDGGATWTATTPSRMAGALYGGVVVPGTDPPVLVTVGPAGADLSLDGGGSWTALDSVPYWGLGFASAEAGWLVGPGGRITRVDLRLERP